MENLIGSRIKIIRKNLGLSMEEFGKLFSPKASKGVVSNWENGYNNPNNERLKKIAELGNVSIDYLLHGRQDLAGNEIVVPGMSYYSYEVAGHIPKYDEKKDGTPRYFINLIKISDNKKNYPAVVRSTLFIENNKLNAIYFENYDYDINYFPIEVTNIFESSKLVHLDSFIFEKKLVDKSFLDTFFLALFKDVSRFLEKYHQCSINDDVKVYYRKQRQNGKTKINIK